MESQIYSLQGRLILRNFQLECFCSVNNKTLSIRIPNFEKSNVLPGDVVLIHLNPINQWIFENGDSLRSIPFVTLKQYFNQHCFHRLMKNFNIVTSTIDLIELINNRIKTDVEIIPTGEIDMIVQKKEYTNIRGYVRNGYFLPEQNESLFAVKSIVPNADGLVTGRINRNDDQIFFIIENVVKDIEKIQKLQHQITKKLELLQPVDKRHLISITIDNEDSRLLDDALSFQMIDDNCAEIGIHCANYVTKIDAEELENFKIKEKLTEYEGKDYGLHLGECEAFSLFIQIDKNTNKVTSLKTGASIIDIKATFSFESFSKTVQARRLCENRIKSDMNPILLTYSCISMVNWLKHIKVIMDTGKYSFDSGSSVIANTGRWISLIAGKSLKKKYNHLALLKINNKKEEVATFRSPLRKPRDRFVIRQLVALSIDMDNEEMIYYVGGCSSEYEFNQLNIQLL